MKRDVNYRKSKWLVAIVLFLIVLVMPYANRIIAGASSAEAPSTTFKTDAQRYYLDQVNLLRAEHNLKPLQLDARLNQSAFNKSNDMIAQKYWGHYSNQGVSFSDYIWGLSPKAEKVGENLARCYLDRRQAFAALVASPTHYQVMINSFTNLGVAESINPSDGCTYIVFHFAKYN